LELLVKLKKPQCLVAGSKPESNPAQIQGKVADCAALELVRQAFQDCARPEHFTNFQHCEECAEHNQTLLSRTPDAITRQEVGNSGWDPICFVSSEGFRYYVPGLARLVIEDSPHGFDWYAAQFLWHLISDGPSNTRVKECSPMQRKALAAFVGHIIETRAEQLDKECLADDAVRAWEIWNDEISA
jgi:hypothetical protein